VVHHTRPIVFQTAEVAVPRELFRLIGDWTPPTPQNTLMLAILVALLPTEAKGDVAGAARTR
jgi:hypothetical protein